MNDHLTKYKGDVAVAHVVADLVEKRWFILTPLYSEHLAFDVLAYRCVDGKPEYLRIQVKAYKELSALTKWSNRTKSVARMTYTADTIDYFAVWLDSVGKVAYVPISMFEHVDKVTIADEPRHSATPFFWYEDFLDISPEPREKRTYKDFGITLPGPMQRNKTERLIAYNEHVKLSRKIQIEDEELKNLVWAKPLREAALQFGISDVGLKKECIRRGIKTPPRGHWIKK